MDAGKPESGNRRPEREAFFGEAANFNLSGFRSPVSGFPIRVHSRLHKSCLFGAANYFNL